ncbi:MAG: type II secretion system GspH family protein [Proteobacteria bacterium]|nr:type II secretion system GspH family protein [Pseudomonadota bacterium]
MKTNKGYSLVELSIVILIMGIIFSLLYVYYPRTQSVQSKIVKSFNTENIDNAIVGFAYAHGRLPFPDNNGTGIENVGATRGTIPEITLGLAEKPVNEKNIPIVYSIFRRENSNNELDADLATGKDRLYALLPSGTRVAMPTPLNQTNTIDFCFALRTAANIATNDVALLYVSETGYDRNVAYVLVDSGATDADGGGQLLDGLNTAGSNFEVPSKAMSQTYDDQVNSKDFSELFGALACGSVISAALHAHDNAVLAADMMHTSFQDYSSLLALSLDVAEVGSLLADAAILQAVAGIADSTSAGLVALAETLIPPPAVFQAQGAAAIGLLVAAGVLSVASTAAAALSKISADDSVQAVQDAIDCFDSGTGPICTGGQTGLFVSKLLALTSTIRNNAITADAAGL